MRSKAVLTLRGLSPKTDAWWWIEMNRIGLDWIFGGRKMFHALEPAAWWGPGYAAFLFEQGWFRRRGIAWGPNAKKEEPGLFLFWAVDEAWTRDLFLTKEVLYHWATTAISLKISSLQKCEKEISAWCPTLCPTIATRNRLQVND